VVSNVATVGVTARTTGVYRCLQVLG